VPARVSALEALAARSRQRQPPTRLPKAVACGTSEIGTVTSTAFGSLVGGWRCRLRAASASRVARAVGLRQRQLWHEGRRLHARAHELLDFCRPPTPRRRHFPTTRTRSSRKRRPSAVLSAAGAAGFALLAPRELLARSGCRDRDFGTKAGAYTRGHTSFLTFAVLLPLVDGISRRMCNKPEPKCRDRWKTQI
jgi:hypothetical protein